jgi:hypothetical protein
MSIRLGMFFNLALQKISERPKVNIKASNLAPMQVNVVSVVTPTLLQYPKK